MKKFFKWAAIAIGALILLAIILPSSKNSSGNSSSSSGTSGYTPSSTSSSNTSSSSSEADVNGPEITLSEFNKIHTGMSIKNTEEIIGGSGETKSESDIADYHTVMKSYKAKNGIANAVIMYQNGKVVSKSQFGLE